MKSQYHQCAIILLFQLAVNSIASQNGKLKIYLFLTLIVITIIKIDHDQSLLITINIFS